MENNDIKNEFTILSEDISDITKIRREKLLQLQKEKKDPFENTKYDISHYTTDIISKFNSFSENYLVSIAGRIMSRRDMGKVSFLDIHDAFGKIQIYVKKDLILEEEYQDFKKFDIGDIVGLKGYIFKTKKGEISIKVNNITLLAKSLLPLPEKFHGLKDTDLRYRQRYLDLIVNSNVRNTFIKRSKIISEIRKFLDNAGFLEVETPILQTIPGGAAARPFITHHNTLNIDMYLRIALELHLKRLIVGGFNKIYEIGRVFRNEGISVRHNPEFTLLELYQAFTDYHDMMDLTENLIKTVAERVLGTKTIIYEDVTIDLNKPFQRVSMLDLVKEHSDVDFNKINTLDEARAEANKHNIEFEKQHLKGDILNLFFEKYVEHLLIQPTFVMDHPIEISPLAKKIPSNPNYTQRFELFIVAREHANAFTELNDPIDQKERFLHQVQLRNAGNEEANMMDNDFINALEYGMPPTGGLGIGIDRLVMLLTNSSSIRDVLLFPTMKPLSDANKENDVKKEANETTN